MEHFVTPDYRGWGPPNASVVAWLAVHFTATTVFLCSIAVADPTRYPGETVFAVLWVAALSGLVVQIARHLVFEEAGTSMAYRKSPFSTSTKGGLFLVLTATTHSAIAGIGPDATGSFFAVLALTIGVRIAGLNAWEGQRKERLEYVRSVFSAKGLVITAWALLMAGVPILFMAYVVDPRLPFLKQTHGWLMPEHFSRSAQYVDFVTNLAALIIPTVFLCEAIAFIARFHDNLNARLADQERRAERAEFAVTLHDRALNLARELRRRSPDAENLRLATLLEGELRTLQIEARSSDEPRPVESCVLNALRFATEYGIDVEVNAEEEVLRFELEPDRAATVESLLLVHFGNSFTHAATVATVILTVTENVLTFEYFDDGGGYDPEVALSKGGGLSTARGRVMELGGKLVFDRLHHLTRTYATVPLQ